MCSLRGLLKGGFVEFDNAIRRIVRGNRGGFQHLVVKRDGKFSLVKIGAEEDKETISANDGLRGGGSLQRVQERLGGEMDFRDDKTTA